MKCPKCKFDGNPNLEEVKMHTKATCPECGAYIKMVGKDELATIINTTIGEEKKDLTLIIKTEACYNCMPDILEKTALALKKGGIFGDGIVINPFNNESYHYEFYYDNN